MSAAKIRDIALITKGASKRRRVESKLALSTSQLSRIEEESYAFGKENECAFMLCVDASNSVPSGEGCVPFTIIKVCDLTQLSSGGGCVSGVFCDNLVSKLPKMFRQEDIDALERRTRAQSSCKLWPDHRQGRLTASSFGDVMSDCRSGQSSKALSNGCVDHPTPLQ